MNSDPFKFSFQVMHPGRPMTQAQAELDFAEAESVVLDRIATEYDHPRRALWAAVDFYREARLYHQALHHLHRLAGLVETRDDVAQVLVSMAGIRSRMEELDEAIQLLEEARGLKPKDRLVWYAVENNLGHCHWRRGEPHKAEAHCRRAIERLPTLPKAYKNLGLALESQERYREAADQYALALQQDPGFDEALHLLEALLEVRPELRGPMADAVVRARRASRNSRSPATPSNSGAEASRPTEKRDRFWDFLRVTGSQLRVLPRFSDPRMAVNATPTSERAQV